MIKCTVIASAAILLATSQTKAGFVVTDQFRLYGCGVTQGSQTTVDHRERGYHRDLLINTSSNGNGRTSAKIEHESLIENDVYKSKNLINLTAGFGTPRVEGAGGLAISSVQLVVDKITTVRINYEIDIQSGINSSHLFALENESINQEIFLLNALESQSGSVLLTLDPGQYSISDFISHTSNEPGVAGDWTMQSLISMTVVPAPSTLALLAPAGLIATRRRR